MNVNICKAKNRMMVFVGIIICVVTVLVMHYDWLHEYSALSDKRVASELDKGAILLKMLVQENLDKANVHNEDVILLVQDKINKEYKNEEELKSDLIKLQNGESSSKMLAILGNSIKGHYLNDIENDNNDAFWANKEYVLADFSYNCSTAFLRSYDKEIEQHYNKRLAKDFLEGLREQSLGEIPFWTFLPNDYSIKIESQDFSKILNVYRSYKGDLRSINNVEYLQVNYMYQNVDVLGNSTVLNNGVRNQEIYQLILVQGFNIVDIIHDNPYYNSEFALIRNNIANLEMDLQSKTRHFTIVVFFVTIIIACMFLLLGREFNHQLELKQNSK